MLLLLQLFLGLIYRLFSSSSIAPVEPSTGQVVQDEYIVVFNERATDELGEKFTENTDLLICSSAD